MTIQPRAQQQPLNNPPHHISYREGEKFTLSQADKNSYQKYGYLKLDNVFTESEVNYLEEYFDLFTSGSVEGMGKDLCDMSGSYDDDFMDFALVNAMLPRVYLPEIQGNIFEKISSHIAEQLMDGDAVLDYDQFLAKKPNHPRAKFAWHQDMGYWPMTSDTRTATFSLALNDSNRENGCIRFIPESQKEKRLFPHRPVSSQNSNSNREDSHTLEVDVSEKEVVHVPVKRGGLTIHDEWIVHGSSGNSSPNWRKTYIAAYRTRATVEAERAMGFTHSHNDNVNWKSTLELDSN